MHNKEFQIDLTEDIEYLIDNNLFFEKIYIHSCPIYVEHIIEYKLNNKLSLNELVENTIDKYKYDLLENKRIEELEDDCNLLYTKKRYKNNISTKKLYELKLKFLNSTLHHLEVVICSGKNPYLNKFYHFINSINHSLYIRKNQFNNSSTQYTLNNYEDKTDAMITNAENFNNQNDLNDAKIHKGIIDTIKEDKIEGSLILSSITNKMLFKIIEMSENEEFEKEDIFTLKRNQQLHKRLEKVNFTESEMYNGFAQACYWNYAQSGFKNYKRHRGIFNKKRTNTIPYIRKDSIENEVRELFNLAFDKDRIVQIRKSSKVPNTLKMYDGIYIYTTKDLTKLDSQFYDFMIKNFFIETEKIRKFKNENDNEFNSFISTLRILFY